MCMKQWQQSLGHTVSVNYYFYSLFFNTKSFPQFRSNAKKTTGIAFSHPHNSTERRFQNAHFTDEETEVLRDNNISMATLDSNCPTPKPKLIVTLLYFFNHQNFDDIWLITFLIYTVNKHIHQVNVIIQLIYQSGHIHIHPYVVIRVGLSVS